MKKILGILLFITMSFACTAKNPATKYQISKEMDFGEYGPWKVMSVKFTYNSNNQLIYKEDTWKNKIWFEYDKDGNLSKEYGFDGASYWDEGDSEQYEVVKNYDKHGNVIYEKGNDCEYWCEYEYNSNGKIMKEYLYELCN